MLVTFTIKSMRFNRPSDTFPRSVVPFDKVEEYGVLANRVVDDTLRHYAYHKSKGRRNSIVDESQWKLFKATKDFAVYKQRYAAKENCNILQTLAGEDLVISKNKCPMLLGIGSVDGRLDDMLYGAVVENTRDLRIRMSYTEEDVEDAQILQVLASPTADNPFSCGSVIWVVNGSSPIPFMKKRDVVQLHFVGTRQLANGERIGFSIWHSVDIRNAPSLYNNNDLVRAKSSFCVIWRQATENTIDVYHRGFVAYMGNAPEFTSTTVGVQATFAAQNIIHAAYAKKFFRYIETLPHFMNRSSTRSSESIPTECSGGCCSNVTLKFGVCIVCRKVKLTLFFCRARWH